LAGSVCKTPTVSERLGLVRHDISSRQILNMP
jgi:hypothetical protein